MTDENKALEWWQWAVILVFGLIVFTVIFLWFSPVVGLLKWMSEGNHWLILILIIGALMFLAVVYLWLKSMGVPERRMSPWAVTLEASCRDYEGGLMRYRKKADNIFYSRPEVIRLVHHGLWLFNGELGLFGEGGCAALLMGYAPIKSGDTKLGEIYRTYRHKLGDKEIGILKDPELGIAEAINRLDQFKQIIEKEGETLER